MSATIGEFLDRIARSRILAEEQTGEIRARGESADSTLDATNFAAQIVDDGLLSEYQARRILADDYRGLVVNDYVIFERVGGGSMGEVFRARHRREDHDVALKLFAPQVIAAGASVDGFRSEVEAAAGLDHMNIVVPYDAGECEGVWYLATQFIEGSDLTSLIHEYGPLNLEDALEVVVQIARGLAKAHARGMLHRDIKPTNIVLSDDGEAKILDVGLSQFRSSTAPVVAHPDDGSLNGAADAYKAPECVAAVRPADERSDIYSLGCTFFFLLAGRCFEPGGIDRGRNSPLAEVAGDIPIAVESIFRRMVATDPADRYPSVTSLLRDLEAISAPANAAPEEVEPIAAADSDRSAAVSSAAVETAPRPTAERDSVKDGSREDAAAAQSSKRLTYAVIGLVVLVSLAILVIVKSHSLRSQLDAVDHARDRFVGRFDSDLAKLMSDGTFAAVTAEHECDAVGTDPFGAVGEIGVGVLQQAILMNAGFAGENVAAADRLHGRHRDAGEIGDQFAQRGELGGVDLRGAAVLIFVQRQRHGDFFERGVPRPFADSVNGALHDIRPFGDAGEGVRDREPQIVVKVNRQQCLIDVGDVVLNVTDEVACFFRRQHADRIGKADRRRPGVDCFRVAAAEVFAFGAAGIFGAEGDDRKGLRRVADSVGDDADDFVFRLFEFVFAMQRARAAEQADAPLVFGVSLKSAIGGIDVGADRSAQSGQHRLFDHAHHFADRFDVGFRGGGEPGVEGMHACLFECFGDAEFVVGFERRAGHLFAVAQRGVAEQDGSGVFVMPDNHRFDDILYRLLGFFEQSAEHICGHPRQCIEISPTA
eukprot:g33085.t1